MNTQKLSRKIIILCWSMCLFSSLMLCRQYAVAQDFQIFEGQDYTLTMHPEGRVVSLHISPEEYDEWNKNAYGDNVKKMTTRIYNHIQKGFDFIIFINNDRNPKLFTERAEQSDHLTNVDGQTVIYLNSLGKILNGPYLHEIAHKWGNFIPDFGLGTHWGFSGVNGQLGGFADHTWQDIGGGNYQANDGKRRSTKFSTGPNTNTKPYGDLELYLMGMLPAAEVKPFHMCKKAALSNNPLSAKFGIFTAESCEVVTINEIQQKLNNAGIPLPDHNTAKKSFRVLHAIITTDDSQRASLFRKAVSDGYLVFKTPNATLWDAVDEHILYMTQKQNPFEGELYNFYQATGGRGTLEAGDLKSLLTGSPTKTITGTLAEEAAERKATESGLNVIQPTQDTMGKLVAFKQADGSLRVAMIHGYDLHRPPRFKIKYTPNGRLEEIPIENAIRYLTDEEKETVKQGDQLQ